MRRLGSISLGSISDDQVKQVAFGQIGSVASAQMELAHVIRSGDGQRRTRQWFDFPRGKVGNAPVARKIDGLGSCRGEASKPLRPILLGGQGVFDSYGFWNARCVPYTFAWQLSEPEVAFFLA
jgi:hypothetical protein